MEWWNQKRYYFYFFELIKKAASPLTYPLVSVRVLRQWAGKLLSANSRNTGGPAESMSRYSCRDYNSTKAAGTSPFLISLPIAQQSLSKGQQSAQI